MVATRIVRSLNRAPGPRRRGGLLLTALLAALATAPLAACSDSGGGLPDAAPSDAAPSDARVVADSAVVTDAGPGDVPLPTDVPADRSDGAVGLDRADAGGLLLTVTLNGVSRSFDRAQLGLIRDGSGQVTELYVEAYRGGDQACPGPDSPTPDYTLIVSGIPRPEPGGVYTDADGITVSLLDFVGDLTPGPAPERFPTVRLTVQQVVVDPPEAAVLVGTLEASSASGQLEGPLDTTHCDSLDG